MRNHLHILALVAMLSLLSAPVSVEAALSYCPQIGSDPINIPVPDTGDRMKITIGKKSREICLLVRVTAKKDGADLDAFTLDALATDYNIVPIARTYSAKTWAQVAGPYADKSTRIKCEKRCTIIFNKNVDSLGSDFRVYTMSLTNPNDMDSRAQVSRFLTQATFGPTKSDLDNFPFPPSKAGLSTWIKKQMRAETPMTSHRAYYRERMDYGMKHERVYSANFRPQHPCDQYSRWRDYAVTGHDYGIFFTIEEFEGKYKMSVQTSGVYEVRTVMDEFRDEGSTPGYIGVGTYQFCWSFGEGVGQPITYRPNPASPCKYINGGSPRIYLPESARDSAMSFVNLPSTSSFDQPPGQLAVDRMLWMGGESHRLLEELWGGDEADTCDGLKYKNNYGQLHGIVEGEDDGLLYHYAGYAAVEENTIESPLADGGALGVQSGMHSCSNVAKDFLNIESCRLSTGPTCVSTSTKGQKVIETNVVVCGSPGEVGNNRGIAGNEANMAHSFESASGVHFGLNEWQKSNLFNNIAISAPDQLRQRVAWALSQILVVTQFQIDNSEFSTEYFLHYHDIFVRNAFGNYRDILREVSYSPMMGEMLSYIDSRSATYVKRWENKESRPDENFAREIMQLFTIGIYRLERNGRVLKNRSGAVISSYDNSDIQTFARAWTGFKRRKIRGNYEGYYHHPNKIDPMTITGEARDQFPKMDLLGGFIGDLYPLCIDLPPKHFLRKGASYRLLGGHNMPENHYDPSPWENNGNLMRPLLDVNGGLYETLCNDENDDGSCDFKPLVTLDENLDCTGFECDVDNLRVIRVQADPVIYYEYVRPACVEMAFADESSLKKVVDSAKDAMCVQENIDQVAFHTCCPVGNTWARSRCEFTAERVSFGTSVDRCLNDPEGSNSQMCDWLNVDLREAQCRFYAGGDYFDWFWTNQACSIKAKVASDGMVALVHNPNFDINEDDGLSTKQKVVEHLNEDNINFFKVSWRKGTFPNLSNNCGNSPSCVLVQGGCLCDVTVQEKAVFRKMPEILQVKRLCKIGFADPASFDDGTFKAPIIKNGLEVYHKIGEADFSMHTVFSFSLNGKRVYVKNQKSSVQIAGTNFVFRNSPHFMSLAIPDKRDAVYETEAVLDMYFYHPNMAPFLAERLIQRFGISNPSPGYIDTVAQAFISGQFQATKKRRFGRKEYGDLESTIAAILLHDEARKTVLDADPTSGSLREPFLKYIGFLRSMEYTTHEYATAVRVENLQEFIGQAPYTIPNVFSFFNPEYSAPGVITNAGLKSPEAQVLNAPTIVGWLNGVFSLIDIGTSNCYSGFGGRTVYWCPGYQNHYSQETYSHGRLSFTASNSNDASDVIDELATILTGGRLSSASRSSFASEYSSMLGSKGEVHALRLAQKLVISTPEFHSTNSIRMGNARQEVPDPQPSENEYKAIVFINLNGGMDGFNMLVPNCDEMFAQYQAARGDVALARDTLLSIDATGSGQPCDSFGLHRRLTTLKSLYDDKGLAFIANMGILEQPADMSNWVQRTRNTALFAHNTQTQETAAIDIFDEYAGIGIGGRIIDVLNEGGVYNSASISVAGAAPPVVSNTSPLTVINPVSYDKFNPVPWAPDVSPTVKAANPDSLVGSGFFGETWSDKLFQSLGENKLLQSKYTGVTLSTSFPNTHHGRQLASVAKLIQTKDARGKDRDIFFSEREGYDLHFDIATPLDILFKELDDAIKSFVIEMKNKELWDKVTIVCVSEFGRTLMGNTGFGTDHAWGNNVFVASGALDGGKIMGEYPSDLRSYPAHPDAPHVFAPGIVIPTTPWESVWSAVGGWFGVDDADMDKVLPNREVFTNIWSAGDMYLPNTFASETEENIFEN